MIATASSSDVSCRCCRCGTRTCIGGTGCTTTTITISVETTGTGSFADELRQIERELACAKTTKPRRRRCHAHGQYECAAAVCR